MSEKRDPELDYVRGLYHALEDLRDNINEHCAVIPPDVGSCMSMAYIALVKARRKLPEMGPIDDYERVQRDDWLEPGGHK